MNVKEAIAELTLLFPKKSVNVGVEIWSHVYNDRRSEEILTQWRVYVVCNSHSAALAFPVKADLDHPATLETVMEEVRQYVNRKLNAPSTIESTRKSLEGL